jgi:hypothetical protein
MSFSLAHWNCLLLLSIGLGAVPLASLGENATDAGAGRPIEFSASPSLSATNRQFDDRSERLKQLERDLTKDAMNPFDNFNPRNSLDGVSVRPFYLPPSAPTIQSKKLKELLDRRKNWVFMTSEEMTAEPSAAEIFNMPEYDENGLEKKEESSLDRFYRSLERNGKAGKDGKGSKAKGERKSHEDDSTRSRDHEDLSDRDQDEPAELQPLRESERALKKMFEGQKADDHGLSPFSKPITASDVFGLGTTSPTMERTPSQKARMEEFKQLFAPGPAVSSSLEPLKPMSPFSSSPSPGLGGADTSISRPVIPNALSPAIPTFRPPVSGFGGVSVVPLEGGLRPANALTPNRLEPGRVNSAVPVFSVPQRKF